VETTEDTLFNGNLRVTQPRTGYRVNVDSLILCYFASEGRKAESVLDLGAGVGVLALGLHFLGASEHFLLIESDPDLAALSRRNLERAGANARVIVADLADGLPSRLHGSADLIVANPPYRTDSESQRPEDAQVQRASIGKLELFLRAAKAGALPRSRICIAYPSRSVQRLLSEANTCGLFGKRLRFVHRDHYSEARLALVEFQCKKPGGLRLLPPLFEWESGERSGELQLMVAGLAVDRT